jgi:hypothetical protein
VTGKPCAVHSTTQKSNLIHQAAFVSIAANSLSPYGAFETQQRKAKSSIAGLPESLVLYEKKIKRPPSQNNAEGKSNIGEHQKT